jgi:hypothetical protein
MNISYDEETKFHNLLEYGVGREHARRGRSLKGKMTFVKSEIPKFLNLENIVISLFLTYRLSQVLISNIMKYTFGDKVFGT